MPTRKRQIIFVELEDGLVIKYTLFPKTQDEIKNRLKKVQGKTGIKDERELAIGRAAFIAAGIQRARELNVRAVRPRHVMHGYDKDFRISLEHPIDMCFPTSVLKRVDKLKEEFPIFRSLVNKIED